METSTFQKITSVQFDGELIIIQSGQQTYKWKVADISKKLSQASESVRNDFKISPSGYGIHWSQIDEDISISGLLNMK